MEENKNREERKEQETKQTKEDEIIKNLIRFRFRMVL